jgi:hypothetical protein
MSLQARQWVVNHPHTHFSSPTSQHADLLNESATKTELIQLLTDLLNKGHIIYFTAIKSDHHDDSGLGLHCHYNGYAVDCWPMKSDIPADWLDASDPKFLEFLKDIGIDTEHYQTGLAGSAYTHEAVTAAGHGVFQDDGGDHVHCGVI